MTLQAVFIDVGNTLLYEKPSRFEIYAESARRRGFALSTAAMQQLMRRAHRELPRQIGGAYRYTDPWFAAYIDRIFHEYLGLAKSELGAVSAELFGRFADPATFGLFPGARELLVELRARGLKVGLISNWSHRLPGLLEGLGLARDVDFVLCSAVERVEKPDPAIFQRALSLAKVPAHAALHAGDDLEKDFLGARHAGLRSVLVVHGPASTDERPRVGDLFQLSDLVARLA
jgi:REG-2-like HAD superfamily hydrolase